MTKREKKPEAHKTPITMALIGGVLILLSGLLAIFGMPTGVTFTYDHLMIVQLQGISIYHGIAETLVGLVMILYAYYIGSSNTRNLQNWSIITVVLSFLSLIGGGGFFIGFALSLIAGIIGIGYVYATDRKWTQYMKPIKTSVRASVAKKKLSANIINTLKPEERKLYSIINAADGAIFQAELVEKSSYSKVKVSRILDRLEGRGIVERKRRGMTNMVILKQEPVPLV